MQLSMWGRSTEPPFADWRFGLCSCRCEHRHEDPLLPAYSQVQHSIMHSWRRSTRWRCDIYIKAGKAENKFSLDADHMEFEHDDDDDDDVYWLKSVLKKEAMSTWWEFPVVTHAWESRWWWSGSITLKIGAMASASTVLKSTTSASHTLYY